MSSCTASCRYQNKFLWLLKEILKSHFQGCRHKKTQVHTHLFNSLGRLSSGWENIEVAAVKVGSRHGSVIPVLAENPNYPEEQSAVVMCGQSLKTNLSSPAPTCAPPTNTGLSPEQDRRTGRQRRRQTGSERRDRRALTVMMWVQNRTEQLCQKCFFKLQTCQCCRTPQEDDMLFKERPCLISNQKLHTILFFREANI